MLRCRGAIIFVIVLCALVLFQSSGDQTPDEFVVICPAEKLVDDAMALIIRRAISEANKKAKALILEVDTPGGLVDSAIDITNELLNTKCQTIAYIRGMGAISAGALISYACKHIVMSPGSNIGASAPVVIGEAQPSEEFNEKTKSFLRSRYRSLAEVNKHEPLLAEAMVDPKLEVWAVKLDERKYKFFKDLEEAEQFLLQKKDSPLQKDDKDKTDLIQIKHTKGTIIYPTLSTTTPTKLNKKDNDNNKDTKKPSTDKIQLICKEGELLTLTSNEAYEYGVCELLAEDIDQLLNHFQLSNCKIIRIEPTWGEKLFKFLVNPVVAGILLLLGLLGLYIEMQTPGFGVAGTIGLICLALLFGSHLIVGIADWADILLIIIGIILLGIEIFILPGFGWTGIIGFICLILGTYLSLTRVVIPEYPWDFARLERAGQSLIIAFLSFLIFAWLIWRYIPKTSTFQKIALTTTQDVQSGYVVQTHDQKERWLGHVGIAETVLRPSGKGRFENVTLDVVSQGEYIQPGTKIKIVEVQGNRYVVIPLDEQPGAIQ